MVLESADEDHRGNQLRCDEKADFLLHTPAAQDTPPDTCVREVGLPYADTYVSSMWIHTEEYEDTYGGG